MNLKILKHIDYVFPVLVWFIIFGKDIINLLFLDYIPSSFLDFSKNLIISNYNYSAYIFELLKLILYPIGLISATFSISMLIAMLVSYFYIKRLFKNKESIYSILFSLIFFFNAFVYSRIMAGHLYHLIAYLLLPVYLFYLFSFFEKINNSNNSLPNFKQEQKESYVNNNNNYILINPLIKLVIAFTICSSLSMHFFAIYFIIFLTACFWFYPKNKENIDNNHESDGLSKQIKRKHNSKHKTVSYIISILSIIILILLLNSFWLQGFFSNKIFSVINTQHEEFFSPKMSKDVSAFAKILGTYGFWRESGYVTSYHALPVYLWYLMLFIILSLALYGFYLTDDKKGKFFFTLFWIGLILATGISHPYTKPFFDFLFNNIPFFNGFRDSHKLVSLIALAYAYFIPIGIMSLISKKNISNSRKKLLINNFVSNREISSSKKSEASQQKKQLFYSFTSKQSVLSILIILVFTLLILSFTFPLIGLWNQINPVSYPDSYYRVNNYLEKQNITGNIIYLPWQTYLTYSWSTQASSDGRIAVPIDQIIKPVIIIGADEYGAEDELMQKITKCLSQKSVECLESANVKVQYVLKDKCAYYSDNYEFVSADNTPVYSTDCIDVYKLDANTAMNANINADANAKISQSEIPMRFIIGILISLITLGVLGYLLRKTY